MLLTFPEPEPLDEAKAKFIGMSRLTHGIRRFDWEQTGGEDVRDVGARLLASRPYKVRRPIPASATKLLRVAWQTELAARLGEQLDDPGLRLATLQTLPVQAYYAVFSSGRALTHTAGSPKDTHAAIHESYAGEHHRRALGAWGTRLVGDPKDLTTCVLTPPVCVPTGFNLMESRLEAADYVWAALRMARRWRLEHARERWLADRKNRTAKGQPYKALPRAARTALVARERPTTLMDFLYELRCATNYRSIDQYAVEIDDDYVRRFHRGLMHLLDVGLLTYEGQIALYAGSATLRAEFDSWAARVRSVGPWATEAGRGRLDALSAAGI